MKKLIIGIIFSFLAMMFSLASMATGAVLWIFIAVFSAFVGFTYLGLFIENLKKAKQRNASDPMATEAPRSDNEPNEP